MMMMMTYLQNHKKDLFKYSMDVSSIVECLLHCFLTMTSHAR